MVHFPLKLSNEHKHIEESLALLNATIKCSMIKNSNISKNNIFLLQTHTHPIIIRNIGYPWWLWNCGKQLAWREKRKEESMTVPYIPPSFLHTQVLFSQTHCPSLSVSLLVSVVPLAERCSLSKYHCYLIEREREHGEWSEC